MTDREIASRTIQLLGGKNNIKSITHCATRLRVKVKDQTKVDEQALEQVAKVKGVMAKQGQYQIIFGTGTVNKIFDEARRFVNRDTQDFGSERLTANQFSLKQIIRIFGDIFVPIIPVLVATGLFMGLRGFMTQEPILKLFGLTPHDISPIYISFTQILTDTAFAFLPVLVCWSTFKTFGGSPVLGIVIGLMLVSPNLPNAYAVASGEVAPIQLFGFIPIVGYQGSVLPAFITGIIGANLENRLRKWIPDTFDLLLTPFLTILIMMILSSFLIGPIFHSFETVILTFTLAILNLPFGLAGLVIGGLQQIIVVTGMHHIFNFLEVQLLAKTGANAFNAIITCAMAAQGGATLAVALKTNDKKLKALALPSTLSAFLGITEPAIFGVNLRFVKPFVMGLIGGAIGGFFASLLRLAGTGMSITIIPGTLLYLNGQLWRYLFVTVLSVAIGFILTWLFGYDDGMLKKIKYK